MEVSLVQLLEFVNFIISEKNNSVPRVFVIRKILCYFVFGRLEAAVYVGETKFSLALYNQSLKV